MTGATALGRMWRNMMRAQSRSQRRRTAVERRAARGIAAGERQGVCCALARPSVGLRGQNRAVGGRGAEGEGPAAMIGAGLVAELEKDGVGAGAQFDGDAADAEGVVAAEVENLLVDAQEQGVVPGYVEGGVELGGRVQEAAGERRADVGLADAAAGGLEDVVEVDKAVMGGAPQPERLVAPLLARAVVEPGRLVAVQTVVAGVGLEGGFGRQGRLKGLAAVIGERAAQPPLAGLGQGEVMDALRQFDAGQKLRPVRHGEEGAHRLLLVPVGGGADVVGHAAEAHLDRLAEGQRVLLEEAVADQALGGAGVADVFMHVVGHGGVVVRFGRVERAAIAGAEGVLAADAAQEDGVFALAVDVDVFGAAVAPAVDVIEQAHAVDEAQQLAGPVGVEHQVVLAVALGWHLAAPGGAEAARLGQGLAGVAVPVGLEEDAVELGPGLELDAGRTGEGHGEVAVVAVPGLGGEEVGVDGIPAEAVHDAEEVADGRFDVGDGLVVEVDADDRFAAGHLQPFGVGEHDPEMLDAAGPVELGVGLAGVGGQGLGDADAVGDGVLGEVEVHGAVSGWWVADCALDGHWGASIPELSSGRLAVCGGGGFVELSSTTLLSGWQLEQRIHGVMPKYTTGAPGAGYERRQPAGQVRRAAG